MGTRLVIALLALVYVPLTFAADVMKAFPPAGPGMTRHVIRLPKQADESEFKVELIIGKTVKTDAANRYFFGGKLEVETIPGWGYQRYVVRTLGPMAGTLMAVDPAAPQVQRFVSLGGEQRLLRYNSRLPLVVYVPDGVEVRYRVWGVVAAPRFAQKVAFPSGQTVVVAEGDFEARSIGSYSVRSYSTQNAQPGDDTTFFSAGVVRARDGALEKVFLANLQGDARPSLVVVIRSVGSGGYLSADAFTIGRNSIVMQAAVSGLPADADPVAALKSSLQQQLQPGKHSDHNGVSVQ